MKLYYILFVIFLTINVNVTPVYTQATTAQAHTTVPQATTLPAAQSAYTTALNNYGTQDSLDPQNPINLNSAINSLATAEAVYAAFLRKTAPIPANTNLANLLDASIAYETALYNYNAQILTALDATVDQLATTLAGAATAYINHLNTTGQASDATTASSIKQEMLDAGIF